jgi:hypothetical protein
MKSLLFAAIGLAVFVPLVFRSGVSAAADVPTSTTVSRPSDTPQVAGEARHRGPGGSARHHHTRPHRGYRPIVYAPYVVAPYGVTPYVAPYTYGPTYYPIYPSFVSPYDVGYRYPGAAW